MRTDAVHAIIEQWNTLAPKTIRINGREFARFNTLVSSATKDEPCAAHLQYAAPKHPEQFMRDVATFIVSHDEASNQRAGRISYRIEFQMLYGTPPVATHLIATWPDMPAQAFADVERFAAASLRGAVGAQRG